MKKFAMFTAIVAMGTLSLALAKPIVPKEADKPKGPAPVDQLAPKMVNLDLDNVSVVDAVAELAKQSGYPIQLQGDLAVLRTRMITLKTGQVSFFQALDQLCLKGGLVETNNTLAVRPPNIKPQPLPAPGVKPVQPAQPPQGGAGAAQPGAKIQIQVQPKVEIQPAPQAQPDPNPAPPAPPNARVKVQNKRVGNVLAKAQPAAKIARPIVRPNQFNLVDGNPVELPTVYAGAVRIRLLPPASVNMPIQQGEALLVFEVTPEPRLQSFSVLGNPVITKAMDDLGQTLTEIAPGAPGAQPVQPKVQLPAQPQPGVAQPQPGVAQPMIAIRPNVGLQRIVTVRLKLGEKEAKSIKDLIGTLNVQILGQPEPVATIDNVLQGKGGLSAKSKNNDVTMILDSIEKVPTGYRAQVVMEYAPVQNAVPPAKGGVAPGGAGGAQVQPGVAPNPVQAQAQIAAAIKVAPAISTGMPTLVDAQGKAYPMTITSSRYEAAKNPGGSARRIYTFEYLNTDGLGEPARLVLSQTRMVQVPIAFNFNNVPLR